MALPDAARNIFNKVKDAFHAAKPHLEDAASATYKAAEKNLNNASAAISDSIKNQNVWHNTKTFMTNNPLSAAGVVTGSVIAGNAYFGHHRRREMDRRAQSNEIQR